LGGPIAPVNSLACTLIRNARAGPDRCASRAPGTTRDGVLFGARTWIITRANTAPAAAAHRTSRISAELGKSVATLDPAGRRVTPACSPPAPLSGRQ
jgi:hypothetical protein